MLEIVSSDISRDYYISNKKIYNGNKNYYKISNVVEKFNPKKFAEWMQSEFANSKFKKQIELVRAVKSNPATISRLMTGSRQSVNNKASQPPKELVIKLAEIFEADVDAALALAGHAPIGDLSEPEIFNGVRISFDRSTKLTKSQQQRLLDVVRVLATTDDSSLIN